MLGEMCQFPHITLQDFFIRQYLGIGKKIYLGLQTYLVIDEEALVGDAEVCAEHETQGVGLDARQGARHRFTSAESCKLLGRLTCTKNKHKTEWLGSSTKAENVTSIQMH